MRAFRSPAFTPLLGAAIACLGLAVTMLQTPERSSYDGFQEFLFAALAFAVLARAAKDRAAAMFHSGRGSWIGIAAGGVVLWLSLAAGTADGVFGIAISLSLPLVAMAAVAFLQTMRQRVTPWQRLGGGASPSSAALLTVGVPLATGVGLAILGRRFATGLAYEAGVPEIGFVVLMLSGMLGLLLRMADSRAQNEQAVAAHLHDSVLQDLAVIQRQADDPEAVRATARAAERGLRDWLAGRDTNVDTTLAAVLRHVCRQVEDEHPGSIVEAVTVRDLPLREDARLLAEATREALRNAIRHGGGRARVFAEVDDDAGITVYVRDTGPGFSLDAVPNERRGVRDAIIGRMASVGGTATIESSAEGTEVTLRLPPPESSA